MVASASEVRVACGVDVGSTNTKVVAIDEQGRVVARSGRPTPRSPEDQSVDAEALLRTVEEMLVGLCAGRCVAQSVATVGIGEDGVLVDDDLTALGPALAWFDERREAVLRELQPHLGTSPGLPVATDAARTVVGWRWAARQPGAGAARSWACLADFAGVRWSGRPFISDTLAARTAAWSAGDRSWVDRRVKASLGAPRLLPPVMRAGEVVGPWTSERLAAARVLAPDAVVVVGGHDHPVGGWAVHRVLPGSVLDSMGTAEVVVCQSPHRVTQHDAGVDVAPGIQQPGATLLCVTDLARNMRWAAREPRVAAVLEAILAGTLEPDGAVASGAFVPGERGGAAPRWALDAPSSELSRASAVVGALAALGAAAVERVASREGAAEVFAAGGWARSPGWVRLKEAVGGRPMTVVPEPEVTAVGAALLAATGAGWSPSAAVALGLADRRL